MADNDLSSRLVDCVLLDDADTLASILSRLENVDAQFDLDGFTLAPILECYPCFAALPVLFGAPAQRGKFDG
jgi:hypothetical protein